MEINYYNEKEALKQLQGKIKTFLKALIQITKLKQDDPDSLIKLDKIAKILPSIETFSVGYEELIQDCNKVRTDGLNLREINFGKLLTAYLRHVSEKGIGIRETSSGWRTGILELQLKPAIGQIRFLYNRQALISWRSVIEVDDFIKAENESMSLLEGAKLPDNELADLFMNAYNFSIMTERLDEGRKAIRIGKFYGKLRLVLIEHELQAKGPSAKIEKFKEFPTWAFLYNLDRYRRYTALHSPENRLGLMTGSQQEVSKGYGMIVNGLDPQQDYQVMCYMIKQGIQK